LGRKSGHYEVRRGHLRVSKTAGSADFAISEVWPLHGVAPDGVLLGGALVSTSRERCAGDESHRPLALVHDRCGALPGFVRKEVAGANDTVWTFSRGGLASPCRWAGAYFADGTRYPIELFVPLRKAWLSGPWAGPTGAARLVDFSVEGGRLKLGARVVDPAPVIVTTPPAETRPAPATGKAEASVTDFAADLLAETRPLYIPVLQSGPPRCAQVDLSASHGTVTLSSYSGQHRSLGYTKDDFGIEMWRMRATRATSQHGRTRVTAFQCSAPHARLTVHGRDTDGYHVEGSRWFFDAATCEQSAARTLPSLVDLLDLARDNCWGQDPRLAARPDARLQSRTYYARASAGACTAIEVAAPTAAQPRGRMRAPGAPTVSQATRYTYEDVANGRFIWRWASESADASVGELVEIRPFKHGVQVGGDAWFVDRATCDAAR
jgi:hypothetical protein